MKISINKSKAICLAFLRELLIPEEECTYITKNIIDAELAGKKTHGFIRLISFKKMSDDHKLNKKRLKLDILRESPISLYIDGHNKLGSGIIYPSIDMAIKKAKQSSIVAVAIKNIKISGYIGSYAKEAARNKLIYIGFHSAQGGLIPYGANKPLWGTNPLTIGIPTEDVPIIMDMASTLTTWGELLIAINENRHINYGIAVDKKGRMTTAPEEAVLGGMLPFAAHKGSGLALVIEMLGGALTGSQVGNSVRGGGGSFYILIDPTIFRSLEAFEHDVKCGIDDLKKLPKAKGFKEVLFPGENSHRYSEYQSKNDMLSIEPKLFESIISITNTSL